MKAGDFARNGAKYLNRIDTFFDKATGQNGKLNEFLTDVGIVMVHGFRVTFKQGKKVITSNTMEFDEIAKSKALEVEAMAMFQAQCLRGFRGQNTMVFDVSYPRSKYIPRKFSSQTFELELGDFVKTGEFGGQIKGGKKVNLGNQYEEDLTESLKERINEQKRPSKYADHVDQIIGALTEFYGETPSLAEGAGHLNQKRPLKKKGNNIIISAGGATTNNIGSTVTDITLTVAGKPVYLSVKFGSTLSFFNCGIKGGGKGSISLFPEGKLKAGEIPSDGQTYLDMFGINHEKFLDVFRNYGTTTGPTVPGHIAQTTLTPAGKRALEDLIASGVGYGYWMCHYTGSHLHFYHIDEKYMNDASTLLSNNVEVNYGGAGGKAKRIDMIFETKLYDFKFNIRNKQGGVYPTHSNGDYYKK
ncbi:hypothetical protein R1080702_167 [Cyanophage S-RIM32]|uniref:Uncharacterized protein n=1 Tax=Cyanophage S-RIM32 TaxID=1278479 RepID=A0A127KMN2_9CAUD|nr:hypothetical protein BJD26_gp089 [Cyanophage S-RIM32]AMO43176.1 hypothetical protein R1080702_167 [Cyanophage S-RIM32]